MKKSILVLLFIYLISQSSCVSDRSDADYASNIKSITIYEGYTMDKLIAAFIKINNAIRDSIVLHTSRDTLSKNNNSLIQIVKETKEQSELNNPLFNIYGPNMHRDGTVAVSMYLGAINSKDTALLNKYFNSNFSKDLFPNDFSYQYANLFSDDIISIIGIKKKPIDKLSKVDIKTLNFITPNKFNLNGIKHIAYDKLNDSYLPYIVIDDSIQKKLSRYQHFLIDLEYKNNIHFFKIIENIEISDTIFFEHSIHKSEF
jgi:hypothetical protein